jgi:ketosteroid isomerase-like protein
LTHNERLFTILGTPRHVDATGDNAYVVVPVSMTFKIGDKQVMQTGATFTVVLRKLVEGWRIAAWSWAKGNAKG